MIRGKWRREEKEQETGTGVEIRKRRKEENVEERGEGIGRERKQERRPAEWKLPAGVIITIEMPLEMRDMSFTAVSPPC